MGGHVVGAFGVVDVGGVGVGSEALECCRNKVHRPFAMPLAATAC